ncbi:MAG: hypothetical protein Q7U36_01370 [bacterium]|nr:hypothetical protein [bacterium]
MSTNKKDKIIATSKESLGVVCEEMFEDFVRGIHNMPEKEKDKAHEILKRMSQT